jgi:hypothetical protein
VLETVLRLVESKGVELISSNRWTESLISAGLMLGVHLDIHWWRQDESVTGRNPAQ